MAENTLGVLKYSSTNIAQINCNSCNVLKPVPKFPVTSHHFPQTEAGKNYHLNTKPSYSSVSGPSKNDLRATVCVNSSSPTTSTSSNSEAGLSQPLNSSLVPGSSKDLLQDTVSVESNSNQSADTLTSKPSTSSTCFSSQGPSNVRAPPKHKSPKGTAGVKASSSQPLQSSKKNFLIKSLQKHIAAKKRHFLKSPTKQHWKKRLLLKSIIVSKCLIIKSFFS
ncbi:Bov1.b2 [Bovine gammaherpesvirus 6]|uniref:Bov1.b2 n=1 Tax=Bovine gammaherpesvirus 6 TaxID=1504288 RepID=A0A060CXF2_9GAMA|nr:Bov1.b2 [Bovine gammaherpesvirus 6]AIB03153.1 Bov1.b2 [Bovine gammaherpesvirus 6]